MTKFDYCYEYQPYSCVLIRECSTRKEVFLQGDDAAAFLKVIEDIDDSDNLEGRIAELKQYEMSQYFYT